VGTEGPKDAVEGINRLLPTVLAEMKKNDPETANSVFLVTSCTSLWEQPGLGEIAKLAGTTPVLSTITDAVSGGADGALIGIGLDRATAGHLAAVYVGRILSGKEKPETMPLGRVSPPDIAISFMKARQIGTAIPFELFENASFVYDYSGQRVQQYGTKNESSAELAR